MESQGPFSSRRAEIAPGIYLVTTTGVATVEDFEEFLEGIGRWMESRRGAERVSLVVDPSSLVEVTAPVRQAYGRWRAENRQLIQATCRRAAYVAPDKLWRGILTAVFWVAKPAIEIRLCESREASVEWLKTFAD